MQVSPRLFHQIVTLISSACACNLISKLQSVFLYRVVPYTLVTLPYTELLCLPKLVCRFSSSCLLYQSPEDRFVGAMTLYSINYALAVSLLFIPNFSAVTAQGIDYSQCAIEANETYWRAPNDTFLYNQYGKPTDNMSQAWGISYESCKATCGSPVNSRSYNWNLLSQCLTSWLLPWLALTAQLPFETRDKQTNFMALLLALGSPSLITFSLALTILNARWINGKFRQVKEDSKDLRPRRPSQTQAIKDARVFLIES